ncbi:MAG: PKD domain-containing protein [Pseudomonadota bacterium]|nr:PKD domain-containing protein [Pseudomonadota bacterium]
MQHPNRLQACLAGCLLCAVSAGLNASSNRADLAGIADPPAPQALANRLASARAPFIGNQGQIPHKEVQFYARLFAGTLFVTDRSELVYALPQYNRAGNGLERAAPVWAFRESFRGGKQPRPRGENASAVRVSHYKGDKPEDWRRGLATWNSLDLGEPYPGIRVTLRATGTNVEKLFHVAPGADASLIDIAIEGVNGLVIDENERLVLNTSLGDILFTAPVAYQQVDGEHRPVEVAYVLAENGHYGFSLGEYDRSRELVIDPLLASTYLGGHNPNPPGNYDDDIIIGMVASGGDVYVAGVTQSPDFPIVLGYDDTLPNAYPDGFIARMSGDLSTVIASTYFGTDSFDRVADLALDTDGSVVVVGQAGYGFPVTDGAYTWSGETPTGGGFVARFSADLSTLLASSVPTPSGYPGQLALGNGGIYFGGNTNNIDFPITPGAYKDTCCPAGGFGIRDYDGFAGKLSSDLTALEAMTYLGGDAVTGISVAPDGNVYITDGSDYEITGYISRMDDGLTTRSAFLTYYPGSQSGSSRTYFNDVVAGDRFVVTAGQTYMNDLPATPGAFDTTCGTDGVCDGFGPFLYPRSDGFIAVYSADLSQTLALTYFGGSDEESIRALELGANGDIYVSGETTSVDFSTTGSGTDTSCGSDGLCDATGPYTPFADGFIARLSPDLSQLYYGSYLGGSDEDRPAVIALDDTDLVYVAGYTRSADFPTTPGAFDNSYNGGTSDAFISLIDAAPGGGGDNEPPIADAGSDQSVGARQIVSLDGTASADPDGQIVSYHWSQVFGRPVNLLNDGAAVAGFRAPNVRRGATRVLVFQLEVTDEQGATGTDRVRIEVTR